MSEGAASPIGRPLDRVDGRAKVAGEAKYAAEFAPGNACRAVIVQSRIPSGRIARIETRAAVAMPGVVLVLTHRNAQRLPQQGRAGVKPPAGREMSLLQTDAVRYNGEPIALVVADTLEQAQEAAEHVEVAYERADAMLDFESAKPSAYQPGKTVRGPPDTTWGGGARALESAPVRISATYTTPYEHHNPMEPHATLAQWDGDRLTLWDSTQYVSGVRDTVSETLGIPSGNVRVISPFVGGGFGCKGSTWSHVVLAAMAAKVVGRPVQLVLERPQMFGPVGGRPRTEQRVELGATHDGHLVAVRHDVISHTSSFEDFVEVATSPTRALYACPNGSVTQRLVKLDLGTPTFMRAPGESTGTFAIECAMDELAERLSLDPVELRLRNDPQHEPDTGRPWSSKRLRQCYEEASRRFGWARRNPKPRSMREGPWLIGWGVATATYPAHRQAAQARAALERDGMVVVRCGTQDIGTGTYTVMTQVAADALAIPVDLVRFELGDTRLPHAPVSGGSMTVASVAPAVQAACMQLRDSLAKQDRRWLDAADDDARRRAFRALAASQAVLAEAHAEAHPAASEEEQPFAARSFGAVFAEVRVDPQLGIVRVPRVVAAYSVGRVLNAKTAVSQFRGGIVWGIGMALTEESLLDPSSGRYVNENLAEYHVPVNADVGEIDAWMVDEDDRRFNPVGARGIGEIGITGVAAAIANAVWHAAGRRIRDLPITLDKLL